MRYSRLLSCAALVLATGCDWTVFDGLETDTPVVLLNAPDEVGSGLGGSLTANYSVEKDEVRVFAGHIPGGRHGVQFDIGVEDVPTSDAVDTNACPQKTDETDCRLADQPAGMAQARTLEGLEDQCFAVGVGKTIGVDDRGVVIRCRSRVEDTLRGPDSFDKYLDDLDLNGDHQPIFFHADRDSVPALAAGAPNQQIAWVYAPGQSVPVELVPNRRLRNMDTEFGAQVAVLRVEPGETGQRLVAVSAPAVSEVWLFRLIGIAEATPIGCLGGGEEFGRTMTSGNVDDDGVDDLAIADANTVTVVSGAALSALEPTESDNCSLAALLDGGLLASFTCGSRGDTEGCSGSRFGQSLAIGDVDGDGDGEVIVGAPRMQVRMADNAGAVLLYDAEGSDPSELTDIMFLSSAESGDELGASVVASGVEPPEAGDEPRFRDTIVAGAPGKNKVAAFYCNELSDTGKDPSIRCLPKK